MRKKVLFISVISVIVLTTIIWYNQPKPKNELKPVNEHLDVIKTDPSPLEGATILPTQSVVIYFNKPLYRSEFKHKFDPEIEHEVEVVNGIDKELGSTFKINFKKPLGLGEGYTLFILPNTKTEENEELGKDLIYHIKTISYRGV